MLALNSLKNINQQLNNQYIAIKSALELLALNTFTIGNFYPSPDARFNVVNALTSLSTIFSVVSGFAPGFGPALTASGAILPAIDTFLGNAAAFNQDPEVGQKEFASRVKRIYTSYIDGLNKASAELFKGGSINATNDHLNAANNHFNITDMMAGGVEADGSALTPLPALETNLTIEILSRSIDALWKTFTINKMWILFVDLGDDDSKSNCSTDSSGPLDSRYCNDEEVYYAYNFVEDGDDLSHVDYPWGGQLLKSKLDINLTVRNEQS